MKLDHRSSVFAEIILAACIGTALFCANFVMLMVSIKLMGVSAISSSQLISAISIMISGYFIAQIMKMRYPGVTALFAIAVLTILFNFFFLGYVASSL